jgi:hypothetical protein
VVGAVRRCLLWALERWTGDRYVRVSLVRIAVVACAQGVNTARAITLGDEVTDFALEHERDR